VVFDHENPNCVRQLTKVDRIRKAGYATTSNIAFDYRESTRIADDFVKRRIYLIEEVSTQTGDSLIMKLSGLHRFVLCVGMPR